MTYRKKLIEVALPLDEINAQSAREKSIRHGHPSTLHLWWARRPLASCRAVLFASLVDDPAEPDAPTALLERMDALPEPSELPLGWAGMDVSERRRQRLFGFISQLVKWENSSDERTLRTARELVRAATNDDPPPVLDPFCGGGSIPLEAQRLGLEAHGSDLNPVAVMITKALIELPPKFSGMEPVNPEARKSENLSAWLGAQGLAEDVRHYGAWMRDEAKKRIGHLYPKIKDVPGGAGFQPTKETSASDAGRMPAPPENPAHAGKMPALPAPPELTVIAWLWARTVRCPNPACGATMPLVRSFWLSKKKGKHAWVEPVIAGNGVRFEVKSGDGEPSIEGTVNRKGATCVVCKSAVPFPHVRAEGKAGRMGQKLMAVVAEGHRGRKYLEATDEHVLAAESAKPEWGPENELPTNPRDFKTPNYGMTTFADLFTPRQLTALGTFSDLVGEARERVYEDALVAGRMPAPPDGDYLGARASSPQDAEFIDAGRMPAPPENKDPRGWHSRGYLPHFDAGEAAQFVTFRLAGSLPKERLDAMEQETRNLGARASSLQEAELRKRIEDHLDRGQGEAWLSEPKIAGVVQNALLHFDGERYDLHGWVIMPNHVHVLATPKEGHRLSDTVHSWKSYTATEANRILGRTGHFWQGEYFDRYIRDERHFVATLEYIEDNPVKAGLCESASNWWYGSAAGRDVLGARAVGSQRGEISHHAGWKPAPPENASDEPLGAQASSLHKQTSEHQETSSLQTQTPKERATLGAQASSLQTQTSEERAIAYADAVATYLAFTVNKQADLGNSLNRWEPVAQCPRQLFARQAIPMTWDFAEGNPLGTSSGSWEVLMENLRRSFQSPLLSHDRLSGGEAHQQDATTALDESYRPLISTDPPYYDNIGYADLSDFFYVWLRRSLGGIYPDIFGTMLVPKTPELVATPYRFGGSKQKAREFFESGLGEAFARMRERANPDYPVTIYYAFKQAENETVSGSGDGSGVMAVASTGWETMLTGLMDSGFQITGTWPMRTEMGSRMVAMGTNALASSVVMVCRARAVDAPVASRREFQNALRRELPGAVSVMIRENIAPVDLAQATIGPGMAIYSRYSAVVENDGSPLSVRTALQLINAQLSATLHEQEGDLDAESRFCLRWFEGNGYQPGEYGQADTLTRALDTSVGAVERAGVVEAAKSKVRLLRRDELPAGWDPETDKSTNAWERAQHLVRAVLEGEENAAKLVKKIGAEEAEEARQLAFLLYQVSDRKKWAEEAFAYNALSQSWERVVELSRREEEGALF